MTFRRLVLDTNVLVSALLFPAGTVSWLRDAWQAQAVVPLASRDTTAELIRVLSSPKFQLTADEREELLADYLPWCETVSVSEPPAVGRESAGMRPGRAGRERHDQHQQRANAHGCVLLGRVGYHPRRAAYPGAGGEWDD